MAIIVFGKPFKPAFAMLGNSPWQVARESHIQHTTTIGDKVDIEHFFNISIHRSNYLSAWFRLALFSPQAQTPSFRPKAALCAAAVEKSAFVFALSLLVLSPNNPSLVISTEGGALAAAVEKSAFAIAFSHTKSLRLRLHGTHPRQNRRRRFKLPIVRLHRPHTPIETEKQKRSRRSLSLHHRGQPHLVIHLSLLHRKARTLLDIHHHSSTDLEVIYKSPLCFHQNPVLFIHPGCPRHIANHVLEPVFRLSLRIACKVHCNRVPSIQLYSPSVRKTSQLQQP